MTDKPKWADLFGIDPSYLEGVPEEPTLTASEVKVLTETASKVAYALGRKDAGEDVAQHIETFFEDPHTDAEQCEDCSLLHQLARIARKVSSQAADAPSDATSGVPGHQEVGSESQVVSNRVPAFCGRCEASTHWESAERAQAWFDDHMASHAAQDANEAARSPQERADG